MNEMTIACLVLGVGFDMTKHKQLLWERNSRLRMALGMLQGDVEALVEEIGIYSTTASELEKQTHMPADAWPSVRKVIHTAARLNVTMPSSLAEVHKALETAPIGGLVPGVGFVRTRSAARWRALGAN